MRLGLILAQKRRDVLVDTGASRSLIRRSVWLEICESSHRAPVVQTAEVLKSLSGHVLPTLGRTHIALKGKSVPLYIVEDLKTDLLLGGDALGILEANINFKSHTVTLMGESYPAQRAGSSDSQVAAVQTEGDKWAACFPAVFDGLSGLRCTNLVQMEIDTGDHLPISQRPYRLPLSKRQLVDEEIEKMLAEDIIERSSSPWASPITLVPKKDGSIRFCVDFRKLNAITTKDAHGLTNIQDIFDTLTGATIFTTLDLKSGYWQVAMSETSKSKTSFITHRGLYQFKRMPFGLCNAPGVFQRLMNHVLAPFIGKSVMVYLDDIVIFSRDPQEHEIHVQEVLQALEAAGLTAKLSKCDFSKPEVKLLGYIVSGQGIRSDPEKTRAIAEMAPPTDVKGVRSFLGLCNYYRQCIPNFAEVAYPLVQLTCKYVRFVWGEKENKAWQTLRDLLVSDRVMSYPKLGRKYKLYTDACDYAVGAILCQEDDQGIERPVQYISKQLAGPSLRWAVIEKEAYAVIHALNKLRPYLYGAEFTIYTDHKPLKSLFLSEVKNTKIQRWAVLLAEYGAPIEYRKGANNIRADTLSRLRPRTDIHREGLTINAVMEEEEIPWEFDDLEKDKVIREQRLMPEYALGIGEEEEYIITDGLLFTLRPPPGQPEYPRLVLPPSARFRVIRRAHTEVGHQGMRKTLDRVQEAYRWPGLRRDIYKTISKCSRCAVHRTKRQYAAPTSMPIAHYPSQILGMDMCGPFPESRQGNRYVLTIIDHCTGWVDVKPLRNKTAENVVQYLSNEYVPRYGPPEIVITDQGLEFKNREVEGYLESLGTDVRHSTPFHPQTNGKIERFHRTFKGILRTFINARPNEWEDHIGPTLWAHRVSTSTVTGYTPFFLTYGRKQRVPFARIYEIPEGQESSTLGSRLQELANAFRSAAVNTEESRKYNLERLAKRANAGEIQIGDSVVILANESSPLDPKWDHGYIVVNIRGPVITAEGQGKRRRIVNRDKVKVVNSEADWDVLRVRETRAQKGKRRKFHKARGSQVHPVAPDAFGQSEELGADPQLEVSGGVSAPQVVGYPSQSLRHDGSINTQQEPQVSDNQPGTDNEIVMTDNSDEHRPSPPTDCLPSSGDTNHGDSNNGDTNHRDTTHRDTTYHPSSTGVVTRAQARRLQRETTHPYHGDANYKHQKRPRYHAPAPPTKRSASSPTPEEAQEGKRQCIELVVAFCAS